MPGWNPWRVLRGRRHLRLQYARLHPSTGRIVDHGNGLRTITLDSRLNQVQRNATLSHELVHDEYDLLWPPGTPAGIVQKGERFVEGVSCDRLVPRAELELYVTARAEFEMVLARDVAEEFEVPIDVADLALRRLVSGF